MNLNKAFKIKLIIRIKEIRNLYKHPTIIKFTNLDKAFKIKLIIRIIKNQKFIQVSNNHKVYEFR